MTRRFAAVTPAAGWNPKLTFSAVTRVGDLVFVRRRVFGGPPYPAATGVQCAGLIRPGALIEIKAIALAQKATGAR